MFAQGNVPGQVIPDGREVETLLDEICAPGHFRFYFHNSEELLAFVAALSRQIVRHRQYGDGAAATGGGRVWLLRDPAGHADAVVIDQPALIIAARAFAPLPLASRIPYDPASTAKELPTVDVDVAALGVDDLRTRLQSMAGR